MPPAICPPMITIQQWLDNYETRKQGLSCNLSRENRKKERERECALLFACVPSWWRKGVGDGSDNGCEKTSYLSTYVAYYTTYMYTCQ